MEVSNNFISIFHNPKEHSNFIRILQWDSYRSFVSLCYFILKLFNINLQYPTDTSYHTGVVISAQSTVIRFWFFFFFLGFPKTMEQVFYVGYEISILGEIQNSTGPDQPDPAGHALSRGQTRCDLQRPLPT